MTPAKRILLVDDDAALRQSLSEQLDLYDEFDVTEAENAATALAAARENHFDFIILDVGLPDMDGREVCRLMRKAGVKSPVLMLTGKDSDADEILGLDAGANDYLTKPYAVFTIGPYSFRPAAKILLDEANNLKVRLTEKETAILKYLYRAGDMVVGRDQLLHEVWGYNTGVTTHTLETHVYRLRQKIEREPGKAAILLTEPGGYRLAV
ncbi:MAG: response regulator transcription factor [Alphaproteobacteria bacterium]